MSVFVDGPMPIGGRFHNYCHMWTDDPDLTELYEMADRIGLNRQNVQLAHENFVHFDLSPRMRTKAMINGAQYVALRDWIRERKP